MKLIELIEKLDELDNDMVIYLPSGEPLSQDSTASIGPIDIYAENEEPPEGLEYLLEVSIAKEVLQVWRDWRSGKIPNKYEKYDAFVYYVEHDAYLPVDN